ncbi:hypothetical protein HOY34_07575 [Xinfangfangia sp. D13-10-4-6]|uniref:DUF6088 family protein n=1 Tax=Pseudogemmobacter hezensis TaxID=2737662 RepID=UPI0015545860|nr:DUF6088 family protein [Pseudogemmobacter hezensis]NPD15062.1 hypothetical protein [Pseudogemmobacter hezensis]
MSASRIHRRIVGKGRGAIFAPADFLDIASRDSVDKALSQLAEKGLIRRLARGLYDYPRISKKFGMVAPPVDAVAQAIARKGNHILQVSPATAANQFGLSTQVPAKHVYMTDGPTRSRIVGRQIIEFRNASPKTLVGAGQKSGAVFQALRYLGKDKVDSQVVSKLARALDDRDRDVLIRHSKQAPAWMQPVVQQIAAQI